MVIYEGKTGGGRGVGDGHNEELMSNITPRQAVEELRRFVNSSETVLNAQNVQIKNHGAGLSEVALLLQHLKDTLFYESRLQRDFIADFVSKNNNGMELLLRTLSILQRLLHDASQQPSSKLSTLLNRNASNKRRKAGVAEADCLDCVKIVTQRMPSAWYNVIEHVTYTEIVLISITSPQLDSKCFALEVLTNLLELPEGFMVLYKALTSLAGKNRDESRMTIIVSQLKHGLNTSRLHIQILVMKFINKILAQAPALNYRVIMQAETENAGFYADRLEKIAAQYGHPADADLLNRELQTWKNAYLSLIWLEKQAQAYTMGTQPVDYLRKAHGLPNGDLPINKTYGSKYDTDSLTKNGDDDFVDSTVRSDRNGYRVYKPMKSNSSNGPVGREITRKKQLQATPVSSDRRWNVGNGSLNRNFDEYDRGALLDMNPSYSPFPYSEQNLKNESKDKHSKQAVRTTSMPPYMDRNGRKKFNENGVPVKTEGILKRTKSEQVLGYPQDSLRSDSSSHRTPREEQIFRQLSRRPSNRPVSPVRFADEEAEKEKWRNLNKGSSSMNGGHRESSTTGGLREWTIPVTNLNKVSSDIRPDPEGRSVIIRDEFSPRKAVRRSASTASEKARMAGFSYLFPENPIVEDIPKRRSKTPTPLQEQVILQNAELSPSSESYRNRMTPNGVPYEIYTNGHSNKPNGAVPYHTQSINRTTPNGNVSYSTQSMNRMTPNGGIPYDGYSAGHQSNNVQHITNGEVVYIPVRVEETGQVMNRLSKKQKNPVSFSSNQRLSHEQPKMNGFSQNRTNKSSHYGNDVEDALKKFDYLNDYSADEGSRSSRFTGGN